MTGPVPGAPPRELALLVEEILRWNRQMNLVTRVDTADRLDGLIRSCERGWALVGGALAEVPGFCAASYMDLGSGSGLPGLVWALARRAAGHDGAVYLVEPRAKRAWFLRRAVRLLELHGATVIEGRWGEAGSIMGADPARDVLVSLKALRMTDREVLQGFDAQVEDGWRPDHVWIARYLPVDRDATPTPPAAGPSGEHQARLAMVSSTILGDTAPRLELVRYGGVGGMESGTPP